MRLIERIRLYIYEITFGGKRSLKNKLTNLVLLQTLTIMIIMIAIFYYAVSEITDAAWEMGISIGREAFTNSSELLIDSEKDALKVYALSQAKAMDSRIGSLEHETKRLRAAAEKIEKNPEIYQPISLDFIEASRMLDTSPLYLQYPPKIDKRNLDYQIGMIANIGDLMIRIADGSSIITSVFIASKDDFVLSVENHVASRYVPPRYSNLADNEWYKKAMEKDGTSFSNVSELTERNHLGFYCAMPYRNPAGEKMGIVGTLATWEHFDKVLLAGKEYDVDKFAFVLDNNGRIIMSTEKNTSDYITDLAANLNKDLRSGSNKELAALANAMLEGQHEVIEIELNGIGYYVAYAPIKMTGWSMCTGTTKASIVEPETETNKALLKLSEDRASELEKQVAYGAAVFLVFFGLLTYIFIKSGKRMSAHFVNPIYELSMGVREIASGNIDKKLHLNTGDEIEHLASCVNAMTDELKVYMNNMAKAAAEKAHLYAELDVAARIQKATLPCIFPPFPDHHEFDIYADMKPAKEVGGDFYDFYLLDDNHLIFTVADVSGKGVAAALFMVVSKTVMKNFAMTITGDGDLAPLIACTNDQLCRENGVDMFVTAFVGMLELSTGKLSYVNAGHNPPLIYRAAQKSFHYLEVERNFILGGMEGIDYVSQKITLERGDRLLLYTDGVTEALNESVEMYGEEHLMDLLNSIDSNTTPQKLIERVHEDLKEYVGTAEQSDDITMMALCYNGEETGAEKMEELVVTSQLSNLPTVNKFIMDSLDSMNVSSIITNRLIVVIEEIFVNIASYAYGDKEGTVTVKKAVLKDPLTLKIAFIDEGMPFNPLEQQDPDMTLSAEEREIGGLGVYLYRRILDSINYEYRDNKNILTFTKILSDAE